MNKVAVQIMFPIIIMAVVATAIFGFSVMSEPGHMMAGCFGSVPGGSCSMLSPIEHFAAHLHAFQSISTAVVQASSLLAALLLLTLAALFLAIKQIADPQRDFAVRQRDDFISPQHLQLVRWIALHEKSDPSFARAMNS